MIVGVAYKTRTEGRRIKEETVPDQAQKDALRLRRQHAFADEYAARTHAAQVEIDIKTIRACACNSKRQSIAARQPPPATD